MDVVTLALAKSYTNKEGDINSANMQTQINSTNAQVALKANQTSLDATNAIVAQKADKSEVTNIMTPKGNLSYESLPTTGNTVGWYYYCPDGDGTNGAGNYVWNGTEWYFGGTGDEGYSKLKSDLDDLNIIPIMNKVIRIDPDHYWGNDGSLNENSGYDAVTVEVEGGKSYSVNKVIGGNNFNVITDMVGNVIEHFTSDKLTQIGNGYYFVAPTDAKYIKLSRGTVSYWNDFIVLECVRDIAESVISDYPIGEVKKIHLNKPLELFDNSILDDKLDSINSKFEDIDSIIGGVTYQYIDKTQYNNGHYWGLNTKLHKVVIDENQYFDCIKVENLKAGKYKISNDYRPTFTIIENIETGYCESLSNYVVSVGSAYKNLQIDFDFNLYMTIDYWRSKDSFMLLDGDYPSSYVYGKYDMNISKAYIKNKLPVVIYCGTSREFTTLKSAIEEATKYMDSVVYIDNGTYDLVSEFGTDYLDSYSGTDSIGLMLKNRVHVIFSSGAKVLFDYHGTNEKVHEYFSPFNSGEYGFTLENAYVESKNCRYSVHDERVHNTDSYHNIYKRCTFIHDSSQASGWHASQAIGGGLGKYGDILIEDCYCKSVSNDDTISYHSTTISEEGNNAKSKIVVRNTYTTGTLCFIPLGNSTEKTDIFVNGCNLRIEPKISGSAETMNLLSWGNTIRVPQG